MLDLSNNELQGRIPNHLNPLCGFGILRDPKLDGNGLYEEMIVVIKGQEYKINYVLQANTIIYLSYNLTGEIPTSIGTLNNMHYNYKIYQETD